MELMPGGINGGRTLIKSHNDIVQLQAYVDHIADWVDVNLLTLNGDKCKVMLISRRRNTQQLQLCLKGSPLEQVQSFKYLGVLIASDGLAIIISMCCTKPKKLLGMLYRKFYNHIDYDSFLKIYLALVRPHLEYAAPVWDPHTSENILCLEDVQKFALRMCSKNWRWSYDYLLDMASIPSLRDRRTLLKLMTLYKVVHGEFYFHPNVINHSHDVSHHHGHVHLHQQFARTNAFRSSFIPSAVAVWNNLPSEALHSSSVKSFRAYIAPLFC